MDTDYGREGGRFEQKIAKDAKAEGRNRGRSRMDTDYRREGRFEQKVAKEAKGAEGAIVRPLREFCVYGWREGGGRKVRSSPGLWDW